MFQIAMVTECIICLAFWFYLYVFMTDVPHMTGAQLRHKIYFDLIVDVENYNHSIPLALLLLEYFLNNIEFTWTQWSFSLILQVIYMTFQGFYCKMLHRKVYPAIDWNNDYPHCLIFALAPAGLCLLFGAILIYATKLKFWIKI